MGAEAESPPTPVVSATSRQLLGTDPGWVPDVGGDVKRGDTCREHRSHTLPLLLICLLLPNGCATMSHGRSQPVIVRSEPPGASSAASRPA